MTFREYALLIFCCAGKTIWLSFLLIMHVLSGLPTIYQTEKDKFYIFTNDGVSKVSTHVDMHQLKQALPANTWCLLDSNTELDDGPGRFIPTKFFMIQTASAREKNLRWRSKAEHNILYFMRPWTLAELIVACVSLLPNC